MIASQTNWNEGFHYQTSVHPTQMTLTEFQESRAASQDVTEFSANMKPGQPTNQLKQVVSKPGHVNNLCHWFVNLKVSCCYKTALIRWHPIKIACKAICYCMYWDTKHSWLNFGIIHPHTICPCPYICFTGAKTVYQVTLPGNQPQGMCKCNQSTKKVII